MENQIIIQGYSADDFFTKVEESAYRGQKRAIEESKNLADAVDWDRFPELMNVSDITDVFPIEEDTARRWITISKKFGDFSKSGKLLAVPKSAVKKYYEKTIIKSKR